MHEALSLERDGVERQVRRGSELLDQEAALAELAAGGPLAALLTRDLREDPSAGFFFECAPFVPGALHRPLRYAVLDSPAVAAIRPDPSPFSDFLRGPEDVVVFDNLRGDARLVAPVPPRWRRQPWGHLGSYLRSAPDAHIASFWRAVGRACEARLRERPDPMWLSTSGLGVSWLHMRLDSRPKYFTWRPFKTLP